MDVRDRIQALAESIKEENGAAAAVLHALAGAITEGAEAEMFELLRPWIQYRIARQQSTSLRSN